MCIYYVFTWAGRVLIMQYEVIKMAPAWHIWCECRFVRQTKSSNRNVKNLEKTTGGVFDFF